MKKFFENFLINGSANLLFQIIIVSISFFVAFVLIIIGLTMGIDEYTMIICVFFFSPVLIFFTLIVQIKLGTLVLPKKQLLNKVITFNSAIEKLNIPSITNPIDFIKNNKIKIYLVNEPFGRKEETRENCVAKFIYYTVETAYFNKGKFEQYIGQNRLCFDYNDFMIYSDILKNHKKEIEKKALEENKNSYEKKISNLIRENNQTIFSIREEYEKKLQDMQDTINRKDRQLQDEITARENYKNQFINTQKEQIELQNKIEKLISETNSNINKSIKLSPFYYILSIVYQELKNKTPSKKYVLTEIEEYFWKTVDKLDKKIPKLKQDILILCTSFQHEKEPVAVLPNWAIEIIKNYCLDIRQITGGRRSTKSPKDQL